MSLDVYRQTGIILREIVKETGPDILKDSAVLEQKLKERNCNDKILHQIMLITNSSNFNRYIPQISTGISMIDVNNIVLSAQRECGLSKDTIKCVLTSILYGLSLPTALETITVISDDGTITQKDTAIVDYEMYAEKYEKLLNAYASESQDLFVELMPELERMVNAGFPNAIYLKGLCYYNGFTTEKNIELAIKYFKIAAKSGCVNAATTLGDCYFERSFPDYTKAYEYYTMLGASGLTNRSKHNLKVILEQKSTNFITMALTLALFVLILIFNVFMASGSLSADGSSHWVSAVFSIIFNIAVFGVSVYSFIQKKYNSIKWVVPCMVVITMLFALIAL